MEILKISGLWRHKAINRVPLPIHLFRRKQYKSVNLCPNPNRTFLANSEPFFHGVTARPPPTVYRGNGPGILSVFGASGRLSPTYSWEMKAVGAGLPDSPHNSVIFPQENPLSMKNGQGTFVSSALLSE